jgi:hypothetical protein
MLAMLHATPSLPLGSRIAVPRLRDAPAGHVGQALAPLPHARRRSVRVLPPLPQDVEHVVRSRGRRRRSGFAEAWPHGRHHWGMASWDAVPPGHSAALPHRGSADKSGRRARRRDG